MDHSSLTRRDFLGAVSVAGAAAVLPRAGALDTAAADAATQNAAAAAPHWSIGSHTRPFAGFRASQPNNPDYILDAVKAAGFQYADMISAAPPPPARGAGAGSGAAPAARGAAPAITPEMIAALKEKLAARGLKSNIANLPTAAKGVPLPEAIAAARAVIASAHDIGQKFAINLGLEDEDRWIDWCKVLADAAAFGQERGVKVVLKHHHGLNNTSLDLLAWVKQVNHPNFGLFVDPGNIVYYTGKDPVKQAALIAPYLAGVVAKDCTAPHFMEREIGAPAFGAAVTGAGNPEVMIQFGTGKVDFAGLYKMLKAAGFNGPTMIEGTAVGATLEETIANARANREFLEKIFASI
jgi:sugar phosphate isomerase/epimerase